jgi:hypothetical protein
MLVGAVRVAVMQVTRQRVRWGQAHILMHCSVLMRGAQVILFDYPAGRILMSMHVIMHSLCRCNGSAITAFDRGR